MIAQRSGTAYSTAFYRSQMDRSYESASRVLLELFAHHRPRSVVDFGCGVGSWLRACKDLGVADVLGLDGDYVDRSLLKIDPSEFLSTDLSSLQVELPRQFDLAISLEVAEHLPASKAEHFVADLCRASDVILFAAAIPGQRGTLHVNERFPSYWIPIFASRGFRCFDFLRERVWGDPAIDVWYRQNCLVFSRVGSFPGLVDASDSARCDVVHPELWAARGNVAQGLARVLSVGREELVWATPQRLRAWLRRAR